MKKVTLIGCLLGFVLFAVLPIHAEDFVTSNVLTISDVEPFAKSYIESRRGSIFSHIMGIYQAEDNKKIAKIFFKYRKKGRTEGPFERGEINCYQVNSGKWYCGGAYNFLVK